MCGAPDEAPLRYRWANVVPGFAMPVRVTAGGVTRELKPTESWTTEQLSGGSPATVRVDPSYYITLRVGTPQG